MASQEMIVSLCESINNSVEAPQLKELFINHFFKFKCRSDLYKKQVLDGAKHLNESIIPTFFRVSMEKDDLSICFASGSKNATSLEEEAEKQIEQCINERCKREATGEHLFLVNQEIKNVSMSLSIAVAENRAWSL